jgi:hypothetical protein
MQQSVGFGTFACLRARVYGGRLETTTRRERIGRPLRDDEHPASVTCCGKQREPDARTKPHAAYGDARRRLIDYLRRDLMHPNANVGISRLCDFGKPGDADGQAARKTQVDLAQNDTSGACEDCSSEGIGRPSVRPRL